jgi:hypothetical protein
LLESRELLAQLTSPTPPPGDAAALTLVRALYRDILQREADPAGLQTWVDLLGAGATRAAIVQGIWDSPEHRGLQVDQLYATYLHRPPDPAGRTFWVNQLGNGLSDADAAGLFLTSPEFQAGHADDTAFLHDLYQVALGRAPDPVGLAAFGGMLQQGVSRGEVARAVLTSLEKALQAVDALYAQFLHRAADAAGRAFWASQLAGTTGPALSPGQVTQALLASDEFFDRAVFVPVLPAQLTFLTQPHHTATGLTLHPITVSSGAGGTAPITVSLGNNQSGLLLVLQRPGR